MEAVYKHKIYCETDGKWEYLLKEDDTALTTCPTDAAHTVTAGSAAIESILTADTVAFADSEKTPDQKVIGVSVYPAEGSSATLVTHDWTDPCTWYQNSTQVTGETMTTSDDLTFSSANTHWIDLTNGRLYDEFNLVDKKEPVIYVDGVADTSATINYEAGSVTFGASQAGKTITCDYWYGSDSTYTIEPDSGKVLIIEHAELQFSKDIGVTSPINFEVWVYNPYDLPNKVKYRHTKYKNMKDIINAANLGTGEIPAVGGLLNPVCVYPFNYATVKPFADSLGAELRLSLDNDTPMTGEWGTATFYILSKDES